MGHRGWGWGCVPAGTSYQPTWHYAAALLVSASAVVHLLLLWVLSAGAGCLLCLLEVHGFQGAGWVLVQYGVAAGQVYFRAVLPKQYTCALCKARLLLRCAGCRLHCSWLVRGCLAGFLSSSVAVDQWQVA
jgi:hypothetical protein